MSWGLPTAVRTSERCARRSALLREEARRPSQSIHYRHAGPSRPGSSREVGHARASQQRLLRLLPLACRMTTAQTPHATQARHFAGSRGAVASKAFAARQLRCALWAASKSSASWPPPLPTAARRSGSRQRSGRVAPRLLPRTHASGRCCPPTAAPVAAAAAPPPPPPPAAGTGAARSEWRLRASRARRDAVRSLRASHDCLHLTIMSTMSARLDPRQRTRCWTARRWIWCTAPLPTQGARQRPRLTTGRW